MESILGGNNFKTWHFIVIIFILTLVAWNFQQFYYNQPSQNTKIVIGSDWGDDEYAIEWELIPNSDLKIFPKYTVWHNRSIVGSSPVDYNYQVWLDPENIPDYKKQITESWRERFLAVKMAEK